MQKKLRIAQFGLGPIGLETVRLAASKPWAEVVGGVDIDPQKCGRDLGALARTAKLRGRRVYQSLDELVTRAKPHLIFHTAVSRFAAAYEQLAPMARQGLDVVSSCEEMLFPQFGEPTLARKLDRLCRVHGSRMVGTGVNPGFAMDILPLCLTATVHEARVIHVRRVVNASTRREPLQRKIGCGLPPAVFRRLLRSGRAGHAGLRESLALIAHCLGWKIEKLTETGNPLVAAHSIVTRYLEVGPGQTCGLHQKVKAIIGGRVRLTLDLKMFLDAADPHDAIQIEGEPPIHLLIPGGIAGDQATAAMLVNTAHQLRQASPGLLLPSDLPLPRLA